MSRHGDDAWREAPESDDADPFGPGTEERDTIEAPAPVCDERCPRCDEIDCTPECIASEEAESDAYAGPTPRKYT